MKKLLTLLLAALLGLTMTACQKREPLPATPESSQSEVESLPEEEHQESARPQSSEEESEESQVDDVDGARQAVAEALDALQTGDREQIQARLDYKNLLMLESDKHSDANALVILKTMDYEIVDTAVTGETGTITVKLTNVNMEQVLPAYFKQAMEMAFANGSSDEPKPEEEMEVEVEYVSLFAGMMADNKTNTVTNTVTVRVLQNGGKWRVQVSDELRNGAMGGYFDAKKATGINRGEG